MATDVRQAGRKHYEDRQRWRKLDLNRTDPSQKRITTLRAPDEIVVPAVTGRISLRLLEAGTGVGMSRTGTEYRSVLAIHQFPRVEGWGIDVALSRVGNGDADALAVLHKVRELARARPHVESRLPEVPELTGNLISDLRTASGLTTQDIADLFAVEAEEVGGWRDEPATIPTEARRVLEAIRALSATLIGGLGSEGVRAWLLAGPDAPIGLLMTGGLDEVLERAADYRQTIAT
jgi:DNA-binding transcriptional regulator YiaG